MDLKPLKSKRASKIGIVLIFAFALVLFAFYGYQKTDIKIAEPKKISEPKPVEITGPPKVLYLGRIAVDVPESAEAASLSVTFILADAPKQSRIRLSESKIDDNPFLKNDLSNIFEITKSFRELLGGPAETKVLIEDEDMSEKFGGPARLTARTSKSTLLDQIDFKVSGRKPPPAPTELEMELALKESNGLLEFKYSENIDEVDLENPRYLDDKKAALISWVKEFLPRYHWLGENTAPMAGELATQYGQISNGREETEYKTNFGVYFRKPFRDLVSPAEQFSSNTIFRLQINGAPLSSSSSGKQNREFGGHPGYERTSILPLNTEMDNNKFREKKLISLHRKWNDLSPSAATNHSPHYNADLNMYYFEDDASVASYYLGLWNYVLSSIRPAEQAVAAPDDLQTLSD